MASQFNIEEVANCPLYFEWLADKTFCSDAGKLTWNNGKCTEGDPNSPVGPYIERLRLLFMTDYRWIEAMKDDEIRATDAMELRRRYAEEVGTKAGKSERDIDRIWKSVHGKCSVLEVLIQLCMQLDRMVNEDEPEQMVGMFFGIFLKNLGLKESDSSKIWEEKIGRFLDRTYNADGSGGGLFPLSKYEKFVTKDQRTVSIWYQMNAWLAENLDDEQRFVNNF